MPLFRARVREPFAPFRVTLSAPIVAVTPCGRSTGAFAIRDMSRSSVFDHDAEHFAALPAARACLSVMTPLRRGDDTASPMPPSTFGSSSLPR